MLKLDDTFLVSLGLGDLPAEEKEAFLSYVYEELQIRIGVDLSDHLGDSQLAEFENLVEGGNREVVTEWLNAHCPNYHEIADKHLQEIKQEIMADKERLLEDK